MNPGYIIYWKLKIVNVSILFLLFISCYFGIFCSEKIPGRIWIYRTVWDRQQFPEDKK